MNQLGIIDLVVDDRETGAFRVHGSALTSASILQRERKQVFDRCWIYLGHQSELENPGDFRCRTVSGRSTIFMRNLDGEIRVFLNACSHQGSFVCLEDRGNTDILHCPHHDWSFDTDGALVDLPESAGYGPLFDKSKMGLTAPSRIDCYRGFYFVCFNRYAPDLADYLADTKHLLDALAEQVEPETGKVLTSRKQIIKANWKLGLEEESSRSRFVYPNLRFDSSPDSTVRSFEPISSDRSEVVIWQLSNGTESTDVQVTETDRSLEKSRAGHIESLQDVVQSGETEWRDIGQPPTEQTSQSEDRTQILGFYRQWHANMRGLAKADL